MRSEAKKVHDLFFDILNVAFSDIDFREARNSMSFSGPAATPGTGPSSRQTAAAQGKRQKPVKDMDLETGPFHKPQTRVPIHTGEATKLRSYVPQKESRLGSSSSREISQSDDAHPFTHPGDLVICKKRRKDREKSSAGKPGNGPLSPTGLGRGMKSPGSGSGAKDIGSGSGPQGWGAVSPQGNSGGSVGWANPVKRLRTDARRRPSHL